MVESAPEITISIVSMNNVDYLRRCLRSIFRHHADLAVEVIVVLYRTPTEKASEIESEFPQVQFVISGDDKTRGYGENQNLGLRRARGRYLVILNDDIEFKNDALRQLRDFHSAHPQIGALHPKLLNEDGSVQVARRGRYTPFSYFASLFHLNGLLARVPALRPFLFDAPDYDACEPVTAECGSGAFFWVSAEVLQDVGFMNESYFLAPDDIDLSKRIVRSGQRMMYLPGVMATHTGSQTLNRVFSKVLPVSLLGATQLFRTHNGPVASLAVRTGVAAFSAVSAAYWAVRWVRGDHDRAKTMLRGRANVARFLLQPNKTTKEIFLESW